jgi:hypothetical protein
LLFHLAGSLHPKYDLKYDSKYVIDECFEKWVWPVATINNRPELQGAPLGIGCSCQPYPLAFSTKPAALH